MPKEDISTARMRARQVGFEERRCPLRRSLLWRFGLVLLLPLLTGPLLSPSARGCFAQDSQSSLGRPDRRLLSQEQPQQEASPEVSDALSKLLAVNPNEKFLWYSPHSGFGNQLIELRNALRVAGLLNRTLIIPPVLRHFDVWLGRCEQRSARHPDVMRVLSWRAIVRLLRSQNYLSMGDIVDLSGLSRSLVKTIDLRIFVALHCGLNITLPLTDCAWCGPLLDELNKIPYPAALMEIEGNIYQRCGRMLGSLGKAMNLPAGSEFLVAQVRRSCRETIWTYGRDPSGGLTSEFREWNLTGSGACPGGLGEPPHFEHEYIREGLAYIDKEGLQRPEPINVVSFMGVPGTAIRSVKILTLGSAMHYFDLEYPLGEARADQLSCDTAFLPFVSPIMRFAQGFARSKSGVGLANEFLCVHYRGSDGSFAGDEIRNASIQVVVKKLKAIRGKLPTPSDPGRLPSLFLMTDMKTNAWRQRLSQEFGNEIGYEVRFPYEFAEYKANVSQEVLQTKYGLFSNRVHKSVARTLLQGGSPLPPYNPNATEPHSTWGGILRDVGVFLEQAVCSCAPWGFIGQAESTISESIYHLRGGGVCRRTYDF
eukprot:TRINITY_DN1430_c0_g1_i1.p1 TRINITY_DN1430_c0_g1~~TRINITY_DN1430_c0_g1_i1.p1  ORF type:complete len:595 (-),score=49.81 TRINITY_DN1430_c0_g1_i1:73-1857(-)